MNINDAIIQVTGGPTVNEGLAAFFGKGPNENLQDAEHRWLEGNGIPSMQINDMWYWGLRAAGYEGSLQDMRWQWWLDGAPVGGDQDLILHLAGDEGLLVNNVGLNRGLGPFVPGPRSLTLLENTSTSPDKTITDFEGLVKPLLPGEVARLGGRRVDHADGQIYNAGVPGIEYKNTVSDGGALITPAPVTLHSPAAANGQLWSRDQTNEIWSKFGGVTVALNAVGLDGATNNACTIADLSTSEFGAVTAGFIFVADAASTIRIYFSKSGYQYPGIQIYDDNICIDIVNGTLKYGDVNSTVEINDFGNWWEVLVERILDATSRDIGIYSAISLDGISNDTAAIGSVVIGNIEIHDNKTIEQVRGLQPIFTEALPVSVDSDGIRVPLVDGGNWNQSEGVALVRFEGTGDNIEAVRRGILTVGGADFGLMYRDPSASALISYDSAGSSAVSATIPEQFVGELIGIVIWNDAESLFTINFYRYINSEFRDWGNNTYSGTYDIGTWFNWFFDNDFVNHLYNTKIWGKLQGGTTVLEAQAWAELNAVEQMRLPGDPP